MQVFCLYPTFERNTAMGLTFRARQPTQRDTRQASAIHMPRRRCAEIKPWLFNRLHKYLDITAISGKVRLLQ
jgi:hypothetical protein